MTDYNEILANPEIAGVYETPHGATDALIAAATANQHVVYRIDMRKARDRDEMLRIIGQGMELPEWYGNNFDALIDCLCDLGWQPAAGYTTILENCHNINSASPTDFNLLIDVFTEVATSWREQDKPFWCFVDQPSNI